MFTEEQLDNWAKFEDARQSGVINMFDAQRGCQITGLTKDEWIFCMQNYTSLQEQAEGGA